jgi:hemolysin III
VPPEYTRKELLVDGTIHAIGVGGSLGGVAVMLGYVLPAGNGLSTAAALAYGLGVVTMFGLSAAYHLTCRPGWKETIRRFDHAAIFLMIAGTYTPFALVGIGGIVGAVLLAAVWLVAIAGMLFKLLFPRRHERTAILAYVGLGWLGLPAAGALVAALPLSIVLLVGAGGILYTVGVAFYLWESLPQHNSLWHASVAAAAACHYVAVFEVVTGPGR